MNVTRVLRASVSRVNGSVMQELFATRERLCGPGRVPGLSAALLYSSGWFLVWLEGTEEAVDLVLARSSRRLRVHADLRVIHRSVGPGTLQEPLTLAVTQWPETREAFARRIEAVERAQNGLQPRDIWARIAEPCSLPVGPPRRRVALVSADDTRAMDIVRELADRFRAPMVYQRFASSDLGTRDVGAAYVDLPIQGEPTRLQVLSRRALHHRMVRESLRGVNKLAVLIGSKPSTAIELADSVAGYVHDSTSFPQIDLVGQCAETARSVGEYLSRQVRRGVENPVSQETEARLLEVLFGQPAELAAA